jgi:hypothetical protein
MGKLALLVGVLVAGAFGASVSAAGATSPLPAASGFIRCQTKLGFITDPASCNGGADSGTVSYSPDASLTANAFGEGLTDAADAFGVLNYSFEVVGGKAGDVVPIDIDTVLKAIPQSNDPTVIGYAFAELGVAGDTSQTITICSESCGPGAGVATFNGTLTVDAVSGVVYTNGVHLEAESGGGRGNASDFNGGMSSVDPFFFVQPTFLNAGDYQILLSPGIGNAITGGVPEPAAWTMLLLGVGAIGAGLRIAQRRDGVALTA